MIGTGTLVSWGFMKSFENQNAEEMKKKFGDKGAKEEKTSYNETELMAKMLRGGGAASLRYWNSFFVDFFLL